MDTNTPVCKGHDVESCDDDNYSSEEHELSDDEGNVIYRKEIKDTKDSNDNINDDDYWTDTASEGEDNEKGRDDDRNDKEDTRSQENDKFNDKNEVEHEDGENRDTEATNITEYRRRHRPGGHRGNSGGRGGHRRGHRKHHGLRTSKVFMPTGRMAKIAVPDIVKGWKCGRPTKLITLDPHGKYSGREYRLVEKVVKLTKRQHTSGHFKYYRFIKIQKLVNGCFWKRYRSRQQEIYNEVHFVNERMLFHGTNKVKELLQNGFDERYASMKGMFGAGLYFAKHSSKSNQYAFGLNGPCPRHTDRNCDKCERHILLCRVTMGKVKKETGAAQIAHAPPGHHSVQGVVSRRPGGLQYPEYVVYRGEQVYAEYLITYKIVK